LANNVFIVLQAKAPIDFKAATQRFTVASNHGNDVKLRASTPTEAAEPEA
jgi:hypothetical protein